MEKVNEGMNKTVLYITGHLMVKGVYWNWFLFVYLGEVDSSFHFMKDALERRQAIMNISLGRAIETGISTAEYAFRLWETVCVEREPSETGTDGWWFKGRKVLWINPDTLSMNFLN